MPRAKTLSAGVVVCRKDERGWLYLLLRAYSYWDFPKGEVGSEPALEAAKREVREETGITELDFRWGDVSLETEVYGRGKVARYYLAQTAQHEVVLGINPELGRPEHHDYRWARFDEAIELLVPRVAAVLRWADQLVRDS